jgi:glycine/D-amino acid oxidase-like deaminating enzyme
MPTTRRVNLRTGTPVWLRHRAPRVYRNSLRSRRASTDVLVIGAGISGALVADVLGEAGLSVLIVDRRGAIKGSSAASTALIQYEIDQPLTVLARRIGLHSAIRHYRRSKLGVAAISERAARLGLTSELVGRDSLYLAGDVLDADGLASECRARQRAGFETHLLSRSHLKRGYGIARQAGILSFGNYAANPVGLTAGFLNAALSRGAQLVAPEEIVHISETSRGVIARARRGEEIHARFAVYATGYEMPVEVPKKAHRLSSTWAIATRSQRRALWPTQCLIWEASSPYLYLRTTTDGRIVCGGCDEDFKDEATRDALLERKAKTLELKLSALFPEVDAHAQFRWTGTFGVTPTGTPSIGFLPHRRRTLAVLGYGGNGFTFSMIAAEVVRGLIIGDGDPDADLYAFRFGR